MEQHQIRVSLSVGTKLLTSVVLLLFTVIVFLNFSTILLFREDKRAYIYQTQANEAVMAGKEFMTSAKQGLNVLRTMLAAVDPRKPLSHAHINGLQSVMDNQSELLAASLSFLNLESGEIKIFAQPSKAKDLVKQGIDPANYQIPIEWMKHLVPTLTRSGFGFLNLSRAGDPPTLLILLADLNLKGDPKGMPIAIGLMSLAGFGSDGGQLKLTIANREGWVLYDSEQGSIFAKENISGNPLFQTALSSKVQNGAQEFHLQGVHYLGSYVTPGLDLVVLANTEWQRAMRATYTLAEKFTYLGAMAVGAAIIFAILFAKTLTAPIGRLYNATKEVAKGNFELSLDETGKDEIGALSSSFNVMSKKIVELIQESVKRVHLENELAIASTVQQTLIPPAEFKNDWLHIQSRYQSADQCGGDWWGFFGVGDKVALMIADATGHGLPSALITASARSCFSVMHKLAQEDAEFSFSPSAMLSFANRVVFDASLGKIMMTFFVAVIDSKKMEISYASAGHNPPWLFKNENGNFKLNSLVARGQRLGEVREAPPYEEFTLPVSPSDIIFMYTDGLTEGTNTTGQMYGKKQVRRMVEANLAAGPEQVMEALMKDFMNHNTGKTLDDDVTMAAAQILRQSGASQMNG